MRRGPGGLGEGKPKARVSQPRQDKSDSPTDLTKSGLGNLTEARQAPLRGMGGEGALATRLALSLSGRPEKNKRDQEVIFIENEQTNATIKHYS